ncbi:DUF2637 domain-containing protein [Micromonospora sp. CA-248212]|uniref:DUF2637 domain-containing protein n=1 Tax=Micromonospora sp. CA-248212 TaxID=3239961 RepID=UPI003D9000B3
MTQTASITFIPDPGESVYTTVPSTPAPETSGWVDGVNLWLGNTFPAWVWPLMWLTTAGLLFASLLVVLGRLRKAHRANPPGTGASTKKLGALFGVAVGFAMLLWAGVLIGSGKNLIGWARDTLEWRDGWDWLVPATLDGVAIAFAILMFAAVRAGRPANRAYRVVWTATIASAAIGFSHEYDGTTKTMLAAIYLGLLALGAMAILHELLDLFRSHTEKKAARVSPVFGLRWVTYTPNTVCAWLAWQNHPPRPLSAHPTDEQIVWYGSVRHAVAHLETVRRAKRIAQFRIDEQTRTTGAPVWLVKVPAVRKLTATVTVQQAEMAEMSARLDKVAADFTAEKARADAAVQRAEEQARNAARALAEKATAEGKAADALRQAEKSRTDAAATVHRTESIADRRVTAAQAELAHSAARLDQIERQWIAAKQEAAVLARQLTDAQSETHTARLTADRAEKTAAALRSALTEAAEKHAAELTETTNRLRTEMAENEARIRAEMGTVNLTAYRAGERRKPSTGQRSKPSEKNTAPSNAARMSDEEAVQALFSADMDPDRVWKQDEVRGVTGAGFGRIPRLLNALAEFHRTDEAERLRSAARRSTAEGTEMAGGNVSGEGAEIARPVAHAG